LCEGPVDAVFTNLIRDDDGLARFRVEGERESITVTYGPRYPVAIAYAPPDQEFLCFEPMAAVTNAFNLFHRGIHSELQSIASGERWCESFWITPAGF
jgi:aldose 1-epimerase